MKKNNYKNSKKLIVVLSSMLLVLIFACSKSFLTFNPPNSISPATLANKVGVDGLLVGAYSLMDGEGGAGGSNGPWSQAASNWVYGSTAGTDAHKGSDPGDQGLITPIETWNVNSSNTYLNDIWSARFDGVQRCNEVLRVMTLAKDMTDADKTEDAAEARFLRGHYNFELRRLFGNVPWIDETISYSAQNFLVPNNTDIFPNIEADFLFAYTNLPETQGQIARANKWAAATYLAKTYIYEKKWTDARTLLTTIIASGKNPKGNAYGLLKHYADNFNPATKNGVESILAAQNSVNDGAGANNANSGDVLNFPYGGPGGCCGFFQPSFSLANAFKVDAVTGLPLLDTYNNGTDLKNDQGVNSSAPYTPDNTTPLDPRIDWTIGRRGIPYLDWGPMPGNDWIRNQASAGPYAPIKNAYYKSQAGSLTDNSSWTPGYTANN
ncbi:MAG TPA: RagB/SusD family nutrient uptake outer membrane protein, partial [Puia sp.]|nr:RagB/SusD family nutrient uptake outer membrane protein [Puia sp.]